MDDVIAQFTSITSATPERAAQYLQVSDHNLEQAIQLYFESDGVDMGGSVEPPPQPALPPLSAANPAGPITIPDDDDIDDDETVARRLQSEMQEANNPEGVRAPMARTTETLVGPPDDWRDDPDEMQAAITEQMIARQRRNGTPPNHSTPDHLIPPISHYIHRRELFTLANLSLSPTATRPGIFNQQGTSSASIWENGSQRDPDARRRDLSRATAGASDASSKSNMLAEMYRPPFELISTLRSWEGVRAAGKEDEKWILVNVQDPNIFDCQVLNRDIWKDDQIRETVREHFIFKQYAKTDPQASNYMRLYFKNWENQDAYPHIAIVDPRTGEQVKVWSGAPIPKSMEFLMQLHEFLDRYSLKAFSKNPVATRKTEPKTSNEVHKMSEEEMMAMAVENSLGGPNKIAVKDADPDLLTKEEMSPGKGKARSAGEDLNYLVDDALEEEAVESNGHESTSKSSVFSAISSDAPHKEPEANFPGTTRIQFRHPAGRVVRRFYTTDQVRRMFEWLKNDPVEGKGQYSFDLIFMGKNLIDVLGSTIEEAGLKNGSVNVEYFEE